MNPQRQRTVQLTVNGQLYQRQVSTRQLLADFLRQELHLTGTHVGCEHGVCGACTVLLNGEPMRSCLLLAVQAHGASLATIEGLAAADGSLHPEYVLVALLALRLQRPVKYTEDRLEHFLTNSQEREQIHRVRVAFNRDGTIVGLRDAMYIDAGAYTPAGVITPWITQTTIPGTYKIPNLHLTTTVVFSNRVAMTVVRGAGRSQAESSGLQRGWRERHDSGASCPGERHRGRSGAARRMPARISPRAAPPVGTDRRAVSPTSGLRCGHQHWNVGRVCQASGLAGGSASHPYQPPLPVGCPAGAPGLPQPPG
jgi:hypothetical protein